MRRRQIFLEQKFHAVGQRLQQSERPHPRGSPAVLHVSHNFAFQPDGVSHSRQQHKESEHSLDHRNDNEDADIQCLIPK